MLTRNLSRSARTQNAPVPLVIGRAVSYEIHQANAKRCNKDDKRGMASDPTWSAAAAGSCSDCVCACM